MRRRTFMKGAAAAGVVGLAGCIGGGNNSPPPRRSEVVEEVDAQDGQLAIHLDPEPVVVSRVNGDSETQQSVSENAGSILGSLSPIGVARAAKGRGATGRAAGGYSSAPRAGRHGRAKLWWGAYAETWYDEHEDEVNEYDTRIEEVGVARIPNFEENPPGAQPVAWNRTFGAQAGETLMVNVDDLGFDREGWYRVGVHIVGEDVNRDFGWEFIDMKVEREATGLEIKRQWKVSPRI